MSYSTGEASLLTKVQGATDFSATNTSRSNWKIIGGGASDHYAILRPGQFEIEWRVLGGEYTVRWSTVIEVWQRYVDDATTRTDLFTSTAAVLAEIMEWPHLGGVAEDASITGGGELREMWREGGNGPAWLMQELTVSWVETVPVTFSE